MQQFEQKKVKNLIDNALQYRAMEVQPHLFGKRKLKTKQKQNAKHPDAQREVLQQLLAQYCVAKTEIVIDWFAQQQTPYVTLYDFIIKDSVPCKDGKWMIRLDLLALFFINLESVSIHRPLDEVILADIVSLAQKLQKHAQPENKTEVEMVDQEADKLADIDISALIDDLDNKQKSHISFKDPSFDDQCDYSACKIAKIQIFHPRIQAFDEKMLRKYNRKLKRLEWKTTMNDDENVLIFTKN